MKKTVIPLENSVEKVIERNVQSGYIISKENYETVECCEEGNLSIVVEEEVSILSIDSRIGEEISNVLKENKALLRRNKELEGKIESLAVDQNNNTKKSELESFQENCIILEEEIKTLKLKVLVRDSEVERLKGFLENVYLETPKGRSGVRRMKRRRNSTTKSQHPGASMLNNKRKSASMSNILE